MGEAIHKRTVAVILQNYVVNSILQFSLKKMSEYYNEMYYEICKHFF